MTFRAWRRSLGLDMASTAQLLGVSLRFAYLWERAVANDNGRRRRIRAGP